jgi:AraC-like DNA-binding protein
MEIAFQTRESDSALIDSVTAGVILRDGSTIRPAENNWHIVIVQHQGHSHFILVGPWLSAGIVRYLAEAEVLWIRLRLGVFMPHLPTRYLCEAETTLPEATGHQVWLKSATWQLPTYENVDTFIDRLAREEILVQDSIVSEVLAGQIPVHTARTVRHHFLQATGTSYKHILQVQRAQQAAEMLRNGSSIIDTIYEAGYFDQAHMTRSLKQYIGYTPAQILRLTVP